MIALQSYSAWNPFLFPGPKTPVLPLPQPSSIPPSCHDPFLPEVSLAAFADSALEYARVCVCMQIIAPSSLPQPPSIHTLPLPPPMPSILNPSQKASHPKPFPKSLPSPPLPSPKGPPTSLFVPFCGHCKRSGIKPEWIQSVSTTIGKICQQI